MKLTGHYADGKIHLDDTSQLKENQEIIVSFFPEEISEEDMAAYLKNQQSKESHPTLRLIKDNE